MQVQPMEGTREPVTEPNIPVLISVVALGASAEDRDGHAPHDKVQGSHEHLVW